MQIALQFDSTDAVIPLVLFDSTNTRYVACVFRIDLWIRFCCSGTV